MDLGRYAATFSLSLDESDQIHAPVALFTWSTSSGTN